jgi:parallel beta-helix repeat protein
MRRALMIAAIVATLPATGRGTTYFVPPGPGTPVQDAIDAAKDGDTIRLAIGVYPEHLFINKAIKIRGVRSASVEPNQTTDVGVDSDSGPVIDVFANDVQLRGIYVIGDGLGGVRLRGNRIKLTDVFVHASSGPVAAPMIDVEQSTSLKIVKTWASSVLVSGTPAGIRIAGTVQDGRIRINNSVSGGNDVGVLLEDNAVGSVRISRSNVNFNHRGIVLQNTAGAIIDHNTLVDDDTTGIELDATSSGNTLVRNQVSGSATDVSDAGSGNCWRNNVYTTGSVPSCP